jgi:hypothetical protein
LASLPTRRPLPAVAALAALLLLTALVWWRVLHRGSDSGQQTTTCRTQVAHATLPAPSSVVLQVLNATKRAGIAARARTVLVADGFNVPKAASNDKPKVKVAAVAQIRFGPKARKAATLVRYYLPGAQLVPTASRSGVVIVSLGAKYRGVASRSTVEAALQRQQIALVGATPSPSDATC